jgi:hypothetical protein
MNCQSVQESFSLYLYGELDFQGEELIEEHLAQCGECAALLEHERAWHAASRNLSVDAPMELLGQCRRELSRSLRFQGDPPPQPSRWARLLAALDISPSHWATQIAVASLLAGLGFGAARLLDRRPLSSLFSQANEASLVGSGAETRLRNIEPVAADPNQIELVFDEIRTRSVTVSRNDPETIRVLSGVATSQLSEDPALRADVLDVLQGVRDPSAVKAVLAVASRDPNPGLRLRALEVLGPDALRNADTQLVLVRMLHSEQNPGVRVRVTSLLSQVQKLPSDPSVAGILQELMEKEPSACAVMQCPQRLRDINASVETY